MITDKYWMQKDWLGVLCGFALELAVWFAVFTKNYTYTVNLLVTTVSFDTFLVQWCFLWLIIIYYGLFYHHGDSIDVNKID